MEGGKTITIIQMNDSHAYFDLHQEMFWQGDRAVNRPAGGYARIATIVKQIWKESRGSSNPTETGRSCPNSAVDMTHGNI
jgi:sulfur-oxidizing protein SoxB